MKKLIKRIIQEDNEVKLIVICDRCQKHITINEDQGFCPMCFEEIEQLNINAWTEYYESHKK